MENAIQISKALLNDKMFIRKIGILSISLGAGLIAISYIDTTNIPNASIK